MVRFGFMFVTKNVQIFMQSFYVTIFAHTKSIRVLYFTNLPCKLQDFCSYFMYN